ncbi:MAG: 16S rRNA (cytosine(967)-C(5))-methyltransferase RsmB [Planctomycetaceae bacterium]
MTSPRGRRSPSKQTQSQSRRPRTARHLAYEAVAAWRDRGVYAGLVIDDICREHEVTRSDRAMAMEITYGVIRRQATLDAVISAFVDRPRSHVENGLWTLLQIGAYQVLMMDGVPAHAAVGETVQVAKSLRRPEWTGLLNGVLRKLSKSVRDADVVNMSADRVPIDATRSKQLDRCVFPDPSSSTIQHLAKAYSYPRWLVRDWSERLGTDETVRLCHWFNSPPLITIRVNLPRQSPEVVREVLKASGVEVAPGEWQESLRLMNSARIGELPGFAEGWFSVQDESAMSAGHLLDPQPGDHILDLCAAPGGKTTHLAELMRDEGEIVALDTDEIRLSRIAENASRLGLSSIGYQQIAPDGHDIPPGPFDRVLVDVPCSNTGVLGKRPEARWRISPEDISELASLQSRLLRQALERVKPGGFVVYSTCSIDPRENREVLSTVIGQHEDVKLMKEIEHQPGQSCDGGYQALLRRANG